MEDDIPYRRIYVDGEVFLEVEAPSDNAEIPIIDNFYIASDNNEGNQWEGRLDDFFVADTHLSPADIATIYNDGARSFFGVTGTPEPVTAQFLVHNENRGVALLPGEISNIVKSEPVLTEGLSQFWYDGNMRANVEAFLDAGDEGSEANPLLADPFASSTTWWAGSQNENVISDYPIPRYPAGLAGTRFDGSSNSDNYGVRLTGEIFIDENGEYLIRDGIDDFTLVAIDQDGNGELDELDNLSSADVGLAGFGDILVLDDDWANLDGSSQTPEFHGIADFENVASGGEWRQIEIWMSEGGGGDGGILYLGSLDDPDIFDDTNGGALTQEERDKFVVRNDKLRTTVSVVESADAAAALGNVEYLLQVAADGTHDALAIPDPNGVFTTTLDVSGATIVIDAEEGIADGTQFKILDADNIVGDLTLVAEGFSFDPATGILTFGASLCNPNTGGDLDGSGTVEFADFLIMSANFGSAVAGHAEGDVDCNGTVEFADFLVLSANFGTAVGAEAASVPEPSCYVSLCLAGLGLGCVRRRRR